MLTKPWQVRLMIEDRLARIDVCGVFDARTATAVRAEFHDLAVLAEAVLLDLGKVTGLAEGSTCRASSTRSSGTAGSRDAGCISARRTER
jgi:hypothetical protein